MLLKKHLKLGLLHLLSFFSYCFGTQYLLIVPREPTYDTELTVTVTALTDPQKSEEVELEFRGLTDPSKHYGNTTLNFDKAETQNFTVTFKWENMLEESGVKLSMMSGNAAKEIDLKFRESSGYIFIQTDKPIYTPRQTVMFRIIAVDEYQRLAKYPIKVDIKNDQGVIVERIRYSANDAFKKQEFELPKETPPGNWTISANFEGQGHLYSAAHTVTFEVKEYVLPRFSAVFKVDTDVITMDTIWIRMNVTALYVYHQPVVGSVNIQLGTWNSDFNISMFSNAVYQGELVDGVFRKDILRKSLFPTISSIHGKQRLYVKVVVTESATQETFTLEDTSTFISHPYYEVDFNPSKLYFRPEFPYTIQAQVKARSGRPASWVHLLLEQTYYDKEGKFISHLSRKSNVFKLDLYGKIKEKVDVPQGVETVSFSAKVMDFEKIKYNEYIFNVSKLYSSKDVYLQIALKKNLGIAFYGKKTDGDIELRYTKATNTIEKITLLVLSKGYVIYSDKNIIRNSDGLSNVILPKELYYEASPSIRVVAYFFHDGEIIMDSLHIEVPDKYCYEELSISKYGFNSQLPSKPKDKLDLKVRGGSKMRVGFVAVDKAVFLLNDRQTLTRKLLFSEMEKHDQGTNNRNDSSYELILEGTGLQYIHLNSEEEIFYEDSSLTAGGIHEPEAKIVPTSPKESYQAIYQPPHSVRNYFPESWMFEEYVLPLSGEMKLQKTLPDSITTWSILAVGLSSNRGVCVTNPVEQKVQKYFFADVRLPYKATRLEEVKIRIAVYNYKTVTVAVQGEVTSEVGLCISSANSVNFSSGTTAETLKFSMNIKPSQTASEVIKVIPLKVGELELTVQVMDHTLDVDIVKKKIRVVSEGLRVKKSITFVLDPEAKHSSLSRLQPATIKNTIYKDKRQQLTTIDLALPKDVIKGTEFCGISAFGDLMADIITHGVVWFKSLIDQPLVNAEEVIGDLGPAVYALMYANSTGLLGEELKEKEQRFLTNSITRLLKYRKGSAFSLQTDSEPATWLTAAAIKILCHATKLTFVDKISLIDAGFNWLANQTHMNGSFREADSRLGQDSLQYEIMLAADVLIAIEECGRPLSDKDKLLPDTVANYILRNMDNINSSLTLAKAAYAMKLYDKALSETDTIIAKLNDRRKKDKLGRYYWSDYAIDNQLGQPFWFHRRATSSAIEATSYALLVFLDYGNINEENIADWLVAQRSPSGAFIGAMDSIAAIEALSQYSQKKFAQSSSAIFLHGNISTDRALPHLHSFMFMQQNATYPALVKNVPVGKLLEVFTEGQGLGQMQVNVEYNVPIDKNQNCHYNVTVEIKATEFRWPINNNNNPLCRFCNFGCPDTPGGHNSNPNVKITARRLSSAVREKKDVSPRFAAVASKKSICIHVCLRYLKSVGNDPITVRVDMLSGYKPVIGDLDLIRNVSNVHHAEYQDISEAIIVQFSKVDSETPTCFGFRAVDEEEVERQVPAALIIYEVGNPAPSCTLDYHPPTSQESLKVFCADFSHINRGECKCFSGLCSKCGPVDSDELHLDHTKKLACQRQIAYQLRLTDVKDKIHWMEIDAQVLSLNKTGSHMLQAGDTIEMRSPSFCQCLVTNYNNEDFYFLSKDVERLVDRRGETVYRYILDENSDFLHVTKPGQLSSSSGSQLVVPFEYLKQALSRHNMCPAQQ